MSNIDDKRGIFTQIGALTSITNNLNLPNQNSSLSSINNSKEIVPFLLDLLVVLVGSEVLKTLVGDLMTSFIDNVEPQLKEELKKQSIDFNSNESLPLYFIDNGIIIPANDIDLLEKYKSDPSSPTGSLIYNSGIGSLDKKIYEAILNPDTDVIYNNFKVNYNTISNSFTFKPVNGNTTIGEFTNEYIDNIEIINKRVFTAEVINNIFGTISSNQNKTQKQLIFEEKIDRSLRKLIDEEDNISITPDELREIELAAQKKKEGIDTVDLGCGIINNKVTLDSLDDLVLSVALSDDPLTVGNAFVGLVDSGFDSSNQNQVSENDQTIKDGFLKKIINSIVLILVSALITPPQIRILLGLTSAFKNSGIPQLGDPIEDIINRRKLANCLSKTAKSTINEFIFNIIKSQILKLIVPVSKLIVKEKINQYLGVIRSLIGV